MTKFIINKLIKSKNLSTDKERQAYGIIASFVGIFINILLSATKISLGLIFSSISVFADGINNLSDATSAIIAYFGFKMSEKPADKKHPFGHQRIEYVSGLIISFIIMFIGAQLVLSSFKKIFKPQELEYSFIIVIVLILSIIVKFYLFLFNKNISKEIDSRALYATALDSLNDVYITSGVLVSILIYKYFNINLDGYTGVLLGILILKAGYNVIIDTLSPILGEAPNHSLVENITENILKFDNVLGIHDLIVHSYGPQKYFASVHIEMDAKLDILVCHELADDIERFFNNQNIQLVVHIDPIVTDCKKSNYYKQIVTECIEKIDNTITMHDFRAVLGNNSTNLIFDVVLPCEVNLTPFELINLIDNAVKEKCPECYTLIQVDKHYNG